MSARRSAEIALHHHEHWDGSGYPDGLRGEHISEAARIVAVADIFDALSMRRPYKEPWPLPQIMKERAAGQHLDARIVRCFVRALPQVLRVQTEWNARDAS